MTRETKTSGRRRPSGPSRIRRPTGPAGVAAAAAVAAAVDGVVAPRVVVEIAGAGPHLCPKKSKQSRNHQDTVVRDLHTNQGPTKVNQGHAGVLTNQGSQIGVRKDRISSNLIGRPVYAHQASRPFEKELEQSSRPSFSSL